LRIGRALILTRPLSSALGEVTDKGSVNQRAVLRLRGAEVDTLFAGGEGVIAAG
jgi:feruloyl-CoA synthase